MDETEAPFAELNLRSSRNSFTFTCTTTDTSTFTVWLNLSQTYLHKNDSLDLVAKGAKIRFFNLIRTAGPRDVF